MLYILQLHVFIILNYTLDCSTYLLLNCGVGWRVEAAPHVTGWTDAYPNIHTITGFGYYSLQTDYDDDEDSSDLVALPVP